MSVLSNLKCVAKKSIKAGLATVAFGSSITPCLAAEKQYDKTPLDLKDYAITRRVPSLEPQTQNTPTVQPQHNLSLRWDQGSLVAEVVVQPSSQVRTITEDWYFILKNTNPILKFSGDNQTSLLLRASPTGITYEIPCLQKSKSTGQGNLPITINLVSPIYRIYLDPVLYKGFSPPWPSSTAKIRVRVSEVIIPEGGGQADKKFLFSSEGTTSFPDIVPRHMHQVTWDQKNYQLAYTYSEEIQRLLVYINVINVPIKGISVVSTVNKPDVSALCTCLEQLLEQIKKNGSSVTTEFKKNLTLKKAKCTYYYDFQCGLIKNDVFLPHQRCAPLLVCSLYRYTMGLTESWVEWDNPNYIPGKGDKPHETLLLSTDTYSFVGPGICEGTPKTEGQMRELWVNKKEAMKKIALRWKNHGLSFPSGYSRPTNDLHLSDPPSTNDYILTYHTAGDATTRFLFNLLYPGNGPYTEFFNTNCDLEKQGLDPVDSDQSVLMEVDPSSGDFLLSNLEITAIVPSDCEYIVTAQEHEAEEEDGREYSTTGIKLRFPESTTNLPPVGTLIDVSGNWDAQTQEFEILEWKRGQIEERNGYSVPGLQRLIDELRSGIGPDKTGVRFRYTDESTVNEDNEIAPNVIVPFFDSQSQTWKILAPPKEPSPQGNEPWRVIYSIEEND